MGIERGAEYLAVIDRGALIGDAATHDAGGLRRPLESLLPDLLSGSDVDCNRGFGIGHVHHAVVDDRLGLLAPIVVETETPDWHQPLDRLLVDLLERTVAVLVVSHAVGEDVVGRAAIAVLLEVIQCLRGGAGAQQEDNACCRCNGHHK